MKRTALITGINGQDGANLTKLLLAKGYRVCGILRRHSVSETQDWRLRDFSDQVETYYGDMTSESSLQSVLIRTKPDEVYNLAAQSHVKVSWDVPQYTTQVNAIGALNVLEAVRQNCPDAKFYQASSSEMFGGCVDADGHQREETTMHPTSPYGCAKLFAYAMTRHYRRAFKMFAVNGILFNHSGPGRGSAFVEQKIVKGAVRIKHGLEKKLILGNLDAQRDFGDSRDYVEAMWMMLQHGTPDDFVVATGDTRSIRQVCEHVFQRLGMNYLDYVEQDARYMRPEELPYLCGDSSKARKILGWAPKISFATMLDDMIETQDRRITDGKDLLESRA
jgi:GDPmannose 4,6-dehydratase